MVVHQESIRSPSTKPQPKPISKKTSIFKKVALFASLSALPIASNAQSVFYPDSISRGKVEFDSSMAITFLKSKNYFNLPLESSWNFLFCQRLIISSNPKDNLELISERKKVSIVLSINEQLELVKNTKLETKDYFFLYLAPAPKSSTGFLYIWSKPKETPIEKL